jgi:CheY-like chemotaxis protein
MLMEKILNVLVLNSDPPFQSILDQEIKVLGYNPIFFQNLNESVAFIRGKSLNLILIYLEPLRQVEIFKVLGDIKKFKPLLPVIFLSSEAGSLAIEKSYRAGVDLFIHDLFNRELFSKSILRSVEPQSPERHRVHSRVSLETRVSWQDDNSDLLKKGKTLNLGSGGMFVLVNEFLPSRRSIISFNIEYKRDDIKLLTGKAIVRWVRTLGTAQSLAGFGAEFFFLNQKEFRTSLENIS